MKLRYKILIGIVVAGMLAVLLYVQFGKRQNSTLDNSSAPSNLPDYTLTDKQQQYISLLVQIYAEDYNSYGYDNLTDLSYAHDNATPALAQKIQQLLDQIPTNPRYANYRITTVTEPTSFSYRYPAVDTIIADIDGTAKEQDNNLVSSYGIHAHVTLKQQGNTWLLDDITITKR